MTTNKGDDNTKKSGKKKKSGGSKRRRKKKEVQTVDHMLAARWIQERLEEHILSEKLIEHILRLEHKYYICKGYKTLRFVDPDEGQG